MIYLLAEILYTFILYADAIKNQKEKKARKRERLERVGNKRQSTRKSF